MICVHVLFVSFELGVYFYKFCVSIFVCVSMICVCTHDFGCVPMTRDLCVSMIWVCVHDLCGSMISVCKSMICVCPWFVFLCLCVRGS